MVRILVAIADSQMRQQVLDMLSGSSCEAQWAGDGWSALHSARRDSYDRVIFDLALALGDGPDVVRKIEEATAPAAFLMLLASGYSPDADRVRRLAGIKQAARFLRAPFTSDELASAAGLQRRI
ncbi:hypothetical protein CW354_14180 [Marinicaulis flavus]|uniref:Response regulatory domain-containing protein n=2 Tax=Hyphococcus luteus TaxID=2058213 RepID=A0A2S7K3V6_9PROT|nr:hypothetical protein CW354_14180 [Marinicaulis flavus]